MAKFRLIAKQTDTYIKEFVISAESFKEAKKILRVQMDEEDLSQMKNTFEGTEITFYDGNLEGEMDEEGRTNSLLS